MSCSADESKGSQVIKAGLLKRYKKGFLSKGFKVVYVELTQDSHLIWYRDQCSYKREGVIYLRNICDFLAVGPYTRSIPGRPSLPRCDSERHIIAIPSTPSRDSTVHWFLCSNDNELNEWMTTISYVLPPPAPPTEPAHDKAYIREPPPPYPGHHNDNSKESHKSYVGSSKLVNGKILIEEQARSNGSEISNAVGVCSTSLDGVSANPWGWTWGWGGGWGCGGWGCFDYGPSQTENNGIDMKNGDVHQSNNECDLSEQPYDQADYDHPDVDPGFDTMCDGGGFDAGFDAGGGFDIGFSIGF